MQHSLGITLCSWPNFACRVTVITQAADNGQKSDHFEYERGIGLTFHQFSGKPSSKNANYHWEVMVGISKGSLDTEHPAKGQSKCYACVIIENIPNSQIIKYKVAYSIPLLP